MKCTKSSYSTHIHAYKRAQKSSPKVNTPMLSKNLFSLHLPASLLLNPSLHILSSVWQREEDGQRKRGKEGDRQRESWLACRLFGLIQENVESPLISNLSPFLSPVSTPSSTSLTLPVYQSVHLTQPHSLCSSFAVVSTDLPSPCTYRINHAHYLEQH